MERPIIWNDMFQALMDAHLGPTLLAAPFAVAFFWWMGAWNQRRTFCYAFLAFQFTSSLGSDVIDWFVGKSSLRFAYYLLCYIVAAFVFLPAGLRAKGKPQA